MINGDLDNGCEIGCVGCLVSVMVGFILLFGVVALRVVEIGILVWLFRTLHFIT